ncbi:MAG TPA: zinc ribbon domain-containing protein [Candidatus Polarisedimenticolia bacterium]|nr:zinc ribbon domain-containing protein [Candidatus Polarisedimenticolia bacterium]
MPLYEYECRKCHHRFERIQQYSEPLVTRCPKCKTGRVDKLPSAPAVQFKGTGWYITDYGRKGSSSSLPDKGESAKESPKESEKKDAGKKKPAKKD